MEFNINPLSDALGLKRFGLDLAKALDDTPISAIGTAPQSKAARPA
ncbi:MAG: hypothetical protein O2912_05280 [Proteobacteria bacterium]|nr:hypothetical protein [Pseudomonadota bacterium]